MYNVGSGGQRRKAAFDASISHHARRGTAGRQRRPQAGAASIPHRSAPYLLIKGERANGMIWHDFQDEPDLVTGRLSLKDTFAPQWARAEAQTRRQFEKDSFKERKNLRGWVQWQKSISALCCSRHRCCALYNSAHSNFLVSSAASRRSGLAIDGDPGAGPSRTERWHRGQMLLSPFWRPSNPWSRARQ